MVLVRSEWRTSGREPSFGRLWVHCAIGSFRRLRRDQSGCAGLTLITNFHDPKRTVLSKSPFRGVEKAQLLSCVNDIAASQHTVASHIAKQTHCAILFCNPKIVSGGEASNEYIRQNQAVNYEPKAPLGLDITSEVKDAAVKLPPLKLRIVNAVKRASPTY